jgi:3',5'-cyclic AMP phosphodiesterase CpdA
MKEFDMDIKHIRLASDLHLEHFNIENTTKLRQVLESKIPVKDTDKETLFVLAGDIVGHCWYLVPDIMNWCQERFRSAILIPGNHEYWTGKPNDQNFKTWEENIAGTKEDGSGVFSIGGQTYIEEIILSDTQALLAVTLWTSCGEDRPLDEMLIKNFPDLRLIYLDHKARASTTSIRAWHKIQVDKLTRRLKELYEKGIEVIVATHHLPSYQLCDPRYGPDGDSLFASNLDHILGADWAPKYWLFGHTHIKIERKLGNTICISNPSGYPGEVDSKYDPAFILDIQS